MSEFVGLARRKGGGWTVEARGSQGHCADLLSFWQRQGHDVRVMRPGELLDAVADGVLARVTKKLGKRIRKSIRKALRSRGNK